MDIKERRTIRKYTTKEIPTKMVNALLTDAARAATMGNMQLYSVIATTKEEDKQRLAPLHFNQPMVMGAPLVLTFCADFNRFSKWCECRKAIPGYDNFLSLMNAVSDTLLFTQNFCTLAEREGLGTCYLGTTIYNAGGIIEVLKMPKLTLPIATITVGWPEEIPEQCERLPLESFFHDGYYHDYTPQKIDEFYLDKEQTTENRHFVELNNKENLAQVFTDCRYTKDANEAISIQLLQVLRKQDFMD